MRVFLQHSADPFIDLIHLLILIDVDNVAMEMIDKYLSKSLLPIKNLFIFIYLNGSEREREPFVICWSLPKTATSATPSCLPWVAGEQTFELSSCCVPGCVSRKPDWK